MILSGFFAFLFPFFARFLPAPQVIFNLLFSAKPTPNTAKTCTRTRTKSHSPAALNRRPLRLPRPIPNAPHQLPGIFGQFKDNAPPICTRSHAPARAYYLYICYIFIAFPRVCARPRAYVRTHARPRARPHPCARVFIYFPLFMIYCFPYPHYLRFISRSSLLFMIYS